MKSSLKKVALFAVILLLVLTAAPALGAPSNVRVFVEYAPAGKTAIRNALQQAGATFHYTFDDLNSFVVTMPGQALQGLSQNPNVVDIEEDAPRYPIRSMAAASTLAQLAYTIDTDGDKVPYGVDAVQARAVWDTDTDGSFDDGAPTGKGVKVCIIDSGFYAAHEDFAGVSHSGTVQLDGPYTTDGFGHGTHVAGTIAAQNNGKGVIGVAPGVSFYIVKFFGDDGLATFSSSLIAASNDCANAGAKVISMSLGGSSSNRREERTFNSHYQDGILSIAAAGNDGNTAFSYPASYDSVVSVAAIDEFNTVADFSQKNSQVELAAPGVGVLSTLPYIDNTTLNVGGLDYSTNHIEFSGRGTAAGALVDGGLCTSTGDWSGAVVLCQRGDISFYDKVMNVQNSGGAAAVIYNNSPGGFLGTLGDGNSSTIIGLSISQEDGQYLVANNLGSSATINSEFTQPASGYQAWDGTSMATPHVSAVAALLWSANPNATNDEIRNAMNATALDLGASGRDNAYGFGLVQAYAAMSALGGSSNTGPSVSIDSPANGSTFPGGATVSFTGSASDTEDGDLSGSISWTSNLDGDIGTGATPSFALKDGTHTITAMVTDTGGLSASDSITITIGSGGTGGDSLFVSVSTDSDSYGKGDTALITVTVKDNGSAAVQGASVEVTINTPSGKVYRGSGTTDASGEARFTYRTNPNKDGTGTYDVAATATLTGFNPGTGTTSFTVQ